MTKSYIFNCSEFVENSGGGVFHKGRRRFALDCASGPLITRIGTLVGGKAAFPHDELPENVAQVLLREGLLHEYDQRRQLASSVKLKIHNAVVEGQRQLVAGLSIERSIWDSAA